MQRREGKRDARLPTDWMKPEHVAGTVLPNARVRKAHYCKGLAAGGEEGSCRARTTSDTSPARARQAEIISMPPRNPPPAPRLRPMISGPKKPPKFPSELMMAIPAAAAVPPRKEVEVAQKGPCMENVAIKARLTNASPGTMDFIWAAMSKKTVAAKAEPARCSRCRPVRSDRMPTTTIAAAVAM